MQVADSAKLTGRSQVEGRFGHLFGDSFSLLWFYLLLMLLLYLSWLLWTALGLHVVVTALGLHVVVVDHLELETALRSVKQYQGARLNSGVRIMAGIQAVHTAGIMLILGLLLQFK